MRRRLAAENPQAGPAIEGVVAEVVGGIRNEVRNASPDFAAAQAYVERQNRIRRIGESEIYQFARDRKFEETAIALSIMCDTPIDVVERALLDPGAEIILILAKVAGLSTTTTKAMLLLRAADRGMSAKDLEQALDEFQPLAAGYRAPGAQLLPHPREKAGRADGLVRRSPSTADSKRFATLYLVGALRWTAFDCTSNAECASLEALSGQRHALQRVVERRS